MFRDGLLKGKRILVTGGGTGLGREIAAKYLELGADLTLCGRRKSALDKTAADLTAKHGGSVKTFACDIRDAAAVDAMIQAIWDDGGPLTGLVNNAAGNFISRTEDLSPRGFDAIANTVFHGTFYVTHAVGKRWIAGGHKGSVISIVVTWVWTGSPFVAPSAMSKAGVHVMTQSLAVEWGRHGIRLNAIAPGIFPTEGAGKRLAPGRDPERDAASINPMRRAGQAKGPIARAANVAQPTSPPSMHAVFRAPLLGAIERALHPAFHGSCCSTRRLGALDAARLVRPDRKPIQRAHHSSPALVQHVRVDHRRRDVRMPEQLLHSADVVAIVQQMGGKEMAQRVAGHALVDTGGPRRFLHRALQYRIIEVMAANRSVLRVNGTMFGRKHVLPGPFITGARVLARERERQMHLAVTLAQVARVQSAHLLQVRAQRLHELFRQQRHPVFLSLALAHQDLAVVEIHILDTQPKAFEVAQSRTVEQAGHQQSRAAQFGKQPLHLLHRKHRRQAHRAFRPRHAVEPAQIAPEHLLVEEQQRSERLPLGGCGDAALRRPSATGRRSPRLRQAQPGAAFRGNKYSA